MNIQSSSPNRTHLHQVSESQTEMINFNEKDSFPRRNITNKLKNANNLQTKKSKFINQVGGTASPSPLSFHMKKDKVQLSEGIVLPNLGSTSSSIQTS